MTAETEHQNVTRAEDSLIASLARAQGKMKSPEKNCVNTHYKNRYADLSSILSAVRPSLTAEGIAMTQTIRRQTEGEIELVTTLMKGDERLESVFPLNPNQKIHGMGSEITYAKRYTLSAICGVAADDDDDGNAANNASRSNNNSPPANQPPKSKKDAYTWCKEVLVAARFKKAPIAGFDVFIDSEAFQSRLAQLTSGQKKEIQREIVNYRNSDAPEIPSHSADAGMQQPTSGGSTAAQGDTNDSDAFDNIDDAFDTPQGVE